MPSRTILEIVGLSEPVEDKQLLLELADEEIELCRSEGDLLGAGEWLFSTLPYANPGEFENILVKVVALWSSPIESRVSPSSIGDLVSRINEFVFEDLSAAIVTVAMRTQHLSTNVPVQFNDLTFRLRKSISEVYGVQKRQSHTETFKAAVAKLHATREALLAAVNTFVNTNCLTAKAASIELVKNVSRLKKLSLVGEKQILSEVDLLLGPAFRKFCESCERQEIHGVVQRAPDLKAQVNRLSRSKVHANCTIGSLIFAPAARHILEIVDQGIQKSEEATTPSLSLANDLIKLDLAESDTEISFSSRLAEQGRRYSFASGAGV